MRQRLDTVERLLDAKGTISRADIEAFVPAGNAAAERSDMIREYILRVMRGPMQALEALTENDPPIESICEELIQN
jgi:5-deoxy-D-glucuronate isomerase